MKRFLVLLILISQYSFASTVDELMSQGNQLRLAGKMTEANAVMERIKALNPNDPAGYSFNLNTLVTELSWEESQTQFDASLQSDAEKLLALCESGANTDASLKNLNYYCGHAHFTLSYYNGIRGNYIRAGRHGTTAIEYLETALQQQPDLIRAKMYLGVAYYYADNLPSFIKLFSRVLWFIPTGNSEKSLPYLQEVMASDDEFNDVAKYIYATLLINGTATEQLQAIQTLEELLDHYPSNSRFQLRYVSMLLAEQRFEDTLQQINKFLESPHSRFVKPQDANLLKIWAARSHLGLQQISDAEQVQSSIEFDSSGVPAWGLAWFELTSGQLADLRNNRAIAEQHYEQVIKIGEEFFVNPGLIRLAEQGLQTPYRLAP